MWGRDTPDYRHSPPRTTHPTNSGGVRSLVATTTTGDGAGSTMMPWVRQVSSSFFLPGVFKRWRFGGVGRSPGFTRLFAVSGRAPAAGITYDPGAAFVTDGVSDTGVSLRSTPAARSPGWLLGSSP